MRVRFRMSGGLAGAVRGVDLDVEALAEPERGQVRDLVASSGIVGTQETVSEKGRDLLLYEIRISRGGGAASLVCDDDHVPATARGLLRFLIDQAKPMDPEDPR